MNCSRCQGCGSETLTQSNMTMKIGANGIFKVKRIKKTRFFNSFSKLL